MCYICTMGKITCMFHILWLMVFSALASKVVAQTNFTGVVLEYRSDRLMEGVLVTNHSNGEVAWSERNGTFQVKAQQNDLLSFAYPGYRTDSLLLTDLDHKRIYLSIREESFLLKEVLVNQARPTQQLLNEARQEAKLFTRGKEKGGISFSPSYIFSRERKNARRRVKMLKQQLEIEETLSNFKPSRIKELVPLPEGDLGIFMAIYQPKAKMNDKQMDLHIMESYRAFKALDEEQLQKWRIRAID